MKQKMRFDFWLRQILTLDFQWWFWGLFLIGLTFILGKTPILTNWQFGLNHQLLSCQTALSQSFFASLKTLNFKQSQEVEKLRQENNLLKQQLKAQPSVGNYLVLSYPYRLITNGDKDQLKVGSMVTSQGVLLGFVGQTSSYASRIILLTDLHSKPVLVVSDGGVRGLVRGDGQNIMLTEVPHQQPLSVGEKIWTVGQIDVAPGLLLGFIDQLVTKSTDAIQTAKIKAPISFADLQEVEVE